MQVNNYMSAIESPPASLKKVGMGIDLSAISGLNVDTLVHSLQGVAIIACDVKLNIHYANAYAQHIFNLDDINLANGKAKLQPATHKRVLAELKQNSFDDSSPRSGTEFTLQYASGDEVRILKVFTSGINDTAGALTGYVLHMHDISDRIFNETQLRHTERLLRSLIDASPDFISFKDKKGRWLEANQNGLDIFQIPNHEYKDKTDADLAHIVHPAYKETFKQNKQSDEKTWANGKISREEQIIPLPQGGEKVFDVVKVPLFYEDGSREGLVTLSRDITDRKMAEINLRDRSAMLDALISCDWLLHSSANWRSIADKVLEQLCLAARFNRGTIFQNVKNSPNDKMLQAEAVIQWKGIGQFDQGAPHQKLHFYADGCGRWIEILKQGNPVYGATSQFPASEQRFLKAHNTQSLVLVPLFVNSTFWGALMIERCMPSSQIYPQELGAIMAITRSLGVAIQRQSTEKRLMQAKIAFDSASEGIMILDENAQVIAINQGFTQITGFTEEEVFGFTPRILQSPDREVWPILKSRGKWRGEVSNHRKNGDPYQEWLTLTVVTNDHGKIINYVGVFADITKIVQSQNQLHELVNHDTLTGLPNRRLLNELLEQAIRNAERENHLVGLLFIDLDRFKAVNDSLGHQVGDKLLLEVSKRITQSIRSNDVVARLGGDEFMVMMNLLETPDDAAIVAKKIIHALQIEFIVDGKEIFIGASIGISIYPRDSDNFEGLVKAADIAMYQVKNAGKNNHCFYSSELSKNALERFTMETQLRRALERNQFEVYYQPQVSLVSGNIIGAEALIRWNHPELGVVSPAKFIPVAEDTGLIVQIGEWVLKQATIQATQWKQLGYAFEWVSINVSAVQIARSNFADTIYGLIIETDCDPSIIEIELTESAVMQNTQFVIETFDRIKQMGVRIAIDDFGTGYSSLSHLKRLPLNKIKIDQSFVRDLPGDSDDVAITNAIYAMANTLGFSVIAEGIETQEQADFLLNMGCKEGQGYLFSKPVTAQEFTALLTSTHSEPLPYARQKQNV